MRATKTQSKGQFRCFCKNCGRGPFVVNGRGEFVRKHACWTKISQVEVIRAREQPERDTIGRAVALQVAAARSRINRLEALKAAFALCTLMLILLGSCH